MAVISLMASTVALELIITFVLDSSCSCAPYDQRIARSIMLVSSSWEMPKPAGMPVFSLIFRLPSRTCSQVSGFMPISPHTSLR